MSKGKGKFGTAVNCMDGRVQLPVIQWLKGEYGLDYIDMVTEPGPDGLLAGNKPGAVEAIRSRVLISVRAHGSRLIAVAGHDDCAGNPVSPEAHRDHILKAVAAVRAWDLPGVTVRGLWVGADGNVVPVKETGPAL